MLGSRKVYTLLGLLLAPLCWGAFATSATYEPTVESVAQHEVPTWFHDAKLGIFVHWGAYSVPGWAPLTGELDKVLEEHGWAYWFANNPYAEWYANSMRIEGSATQTYHLETYGADFPYENFVREFNEAVEVWEPEAWARLFREAGARYVVLTTKHHDGFLLWPSATTNPSRGSAFQAERDLVGDLTEAVRAEGLRMGLYYSGGLDWTFNDAIITDFETLLGTINQSEAYETYATAHWLELIERYKPSILWNDLGYPAVGDLNALFATYYNAVPDGLVNDRFDLSEDSVLHADFSTPEYAVFDDIQEAKWESTRGIGFSFGYNRNEDASSFLSVDELVDSFVDIVSKNGNLLLNVGPMADGIIPEGQRERLVGLGRWLAVNGEGIYDTRPWHRAEGRTEAGTELRFTAKDDALYVTALDQPAQAHLSIIDLTLPAEASVNLLGYGAELAWTQAAGNVTVTLPELEASPAYTFRITPSP